MKKLLFIAGIFSIMLCSSFFAAGQSAEKGVESLKPENELQIEHKTSYKEVQFIVHNGEKFTYDPQFVERLNNLSWLQSYKYDDETGLCLFETILDVSKEDISDFLADEDFKISDYSEKVNLLIKKKEMTESEKRHLKNMRENPEIRHRGDIEAITNKEEIDPSESKAYVSGEEKNSKLDQMPKEEALKLLNDLRNKAISNNLPTEKYDNKINELKNQ